VKALEQQYMREQLRRAGTPGPRVIGLDEVSIKKGDTYRIVVSDLIRQRPIWFGGTDRPKASLDQFYTWLGPRKAARIPLVVMDMWKPFRSTGHQRREPLSRRWCLVNNPSFTGRHSSSHDIHHAHRPERRHDTDLQSSGRRDPRLKARDER